MICVPIASIGWAAGAFVFVVLAAITHKHDPKAKWWKFGIDDLWFNASLICAMQAWFTFLA